MTAPLDAQRPNEQPHRDEVRPAEARLAYGHKLALVILVAERMGRSPAFVEEARKMMACKFGFSTGRTFVLIESEAARVRMEIAADLALLKQAQSLVPVLTAEYAQKAADAANSAPADGNSGVREAGVAVDRPRG